MSPQHFLLSCKRYVTAGASAGVERSPCPPGLCPADQGVSKQSGPTGAHHEAGGCCRRSERFSETRRAGESPSPISEKKEKCWVAGDPHTLGHARVSLRSSVKASHDRGMTGLTKGIHTDLTRVILMQLEKQRSCYQPPGLYPLPLVFLSSTFPVLPFLPRRGHRVIPRRPGFPAALQCPR